jgi:hypothetical protein
MHQQEGSNGPAKHPGPKLALPSTAMRPATCACLSILLSACSPSGPTNTDADAASDAGLTGDAGSSGDAGLTGDAAPEAGPLLWYTTCDYPSCIYADGGYPDDDAAPCPAPGTPCSVPGQGCGTRSQGAAYPPCAVHLCATVNPVPPYYGSCPAR